MKRIGLIVKASNPEAVRLAGEIAAFVSGKGSEVYAETSLAAKVGAAKGVPMEELPERIDTMVVLGGDGTMLGAARIIDGRKIPILGVNLGGLGFLTAASVKELHPMVERVLKDVCAVEERMMLDVTLTRAGKAHVMHRVLNDAVVKGASGRLVRLDTRINREYVTTYRADGLIVATPTGSTAYSLSAAGPILYPTIHSIIVAPICPFNLTNRPMVIPDWMTVDVRVGQEPGVQLILDGQVDLGLEGGDEIAIRRSEKSVYLIRYEGKGYFDILRERLMWEVK